MVRDRYVGYKGKTVAGVNYCALWCCVRVYKKGKALAFPFLYTVMHALLACAFREQNNPNGFKNNFNF